MIYSGTKFYRYHDGIEEPEIIRIYSIPSEKSKTDSVTYLDKDNNKKRMSYGFLIDNYKMLKPDGMIMFSIVQVGEGPDVMVAMQNLKNPSNEPYAICRQSIFDLFTNLSNNSEDMKLIHVGMSISQETCPANIKFNECMMCTGVKFTKTVVAYIDDTLDIILSMFTNLKFDKALQECKKAMMKNSGENIYVGFHDTLKDLLLKNKFMYDFRRCFDIIEVPFHIDEESEGLSDQNILYLENELKINIIETYLIKYSKEINLNEIKRDYKLITSAEDQYNTVYILGYDSTGEKYIPRV